MPPPARYALAGLAVLAFLLASGALARVLAAAGAERAAVVSVVEAQAAGDPDHVASLVAGCRADPACRRRIERDLRRLRSSGEATVLRIDGPSRLASGARTGTARVAWRPGNRLPIVQCVQVRRSGSLVAGFQVQVVAVSEPRPPQAGCPSTG